MTIRYRLMMMLAGGVLLGLTGSALGDQGPSGVDATHFQETDHHIDLPDAGSTVITIGDDPAKWIETQQGPGGRQRGFGGLRGWWRRGSESLKNDASVKAAFRDAVMPAAKATARVFANGDAVALATVVDAQGYLVSKASLLEGELACELAGGERMDAKLIGVNEDYDLALLKIDSDKLATVTWRTTDAPPGTFVTAIGADGDPISIGVISAEPRRVRGSTRPNRRRGWLGITLDGGNPGVGITVVADDSAAQRAGLEAGDQVRSIAGKAMSSMEQIIETIGSHAPGDTVAITVLRDGKDVEVSATLGKPPTGTDPQDQWGGGPFSDRRAGFPRVLPHDTAILPNQCGGPLVDTDGNVVGVNIARALRVTTYAIPADTVQVIVADLRKSNAP